MCTKIFSVIFLIVIVVDVYCTETSYDPINNCFEKFNLTEDILKSLNSDNLSKEQKEILSCNLGCLVKIEGAKNGQTLYQFMVTYRHHHDMTVLNAMRQKLSTCADVGDDECKLMECIDLFSPPWKILIDGLKSKKTL